MLMRNAARRAEKSCCLFHIMCNDQSAGRHFAEGTHLASLRHPDLGLGMPVGAGIAPRLKEQVTGAPSKEADPTRAQHCKLQ